MSKHIVVFCPNPYSLYTTSVCELLIRRGYEIDCVVVRKFSVARFRQEFARDGMRLIRKIWKKLVLRGGSGLSSAESPLVALRRREGIQLKDVNDLAARGTRIVKCGSLNDPAVATVLRSFPQRLVVFTGGASFASGPSRPRVTALSIATWASCRATRGWTCRSGACSRGDWTCSG